MTNLEEKMGDKISFTEATVSLFISTTLDAVLTHWNMTRGLVYEENPFMVDVANSGLHDMLVVKYVTAGFLTYVCARAQNDKRSGFFGKKLHTKYVLFGAAAYYGIGITKNLYYMF